MSNPNNAPQQDVPTVTSPETRAVIEAYHRGRADAAASSEGNAAAIDAARRLCEKVKRAAELKANGGTIRAEDWAELQQLESETRAAIEAAQNAAPKPAPEDEVLQCFIETYRHKFQKAHNAGALSDADKGYPYLIAKVCLLIAAEGYQMPQNKLYAGIARNLKKFI